MRYLALATDYDGTLASDGKVGSSTIEALESLRKTGRRLFLVTGRELPDLKQVFPRLDLFDSVVAENGALLFDPATQRESSLAEPPSEEFLRALERRQVPFSVGRAIVATSHSFADQVIQAIRETGVEWQVIFNKGAAMVLPSGVNKATGLQAALESMGLSAHNVAGIGDAENDHALLSSCEFGVAVANAIPRLKERADWITEGARGRGVEQLIERITADDLCSFDESLKRHRLLVGQDVDNDQGVFVAQSRGSLLIAGPSGSGKSSTTGALLEQMMEQKYQFCLVDPEGDYEGLPGAVIIGTPSSAPAIAEIEKALEAPSRSIVVNLLAIPLSDRPLFFAGLLPRLIELRASRGRPHWILVDEAHHLVPSSWQPAPSIVPQSLGGMVLITVHPTYVAHAALQSIDTVVAIGQEPWKTIADFAQAIGDAVPKSAPDKKLSSGEAAVWLRRTGSEVVIVKSSKGTLERRRHVRKYAQGELSEDRSFYFKGPQGKLNLRAQNLNTFTQLADGVDDETWLHHLRRSEYSAWMESVIKDDELVEDVRKVEREVQDPRKSRERIKEAINSRYTAAA